MLTKFTQKCAEIVVKHPKATVALGSAIALTSGAVGIAVGSVVGVATAIGGSSVGLAAIRAGVKSPNLTSDADLEESRVSLEQMIQFP